MRTLDLFRWLWLWSTLYPLQALEVLPRWGQATVLVNDALFIFGGKSDQFNAYSYTSAPDNNDLLFLSLSSSFTGQSPPWQVVGSSTNASTSQGPSLSWHTLSAFNTSFVLLFGGEPAPNSHISDLDASDSAALLNVFNHLQPVWTTEPPSWAGEPTRRMRHATATTPSGLIVIIGGEKADGSSLGFSDNYVFDPNYAQFNKLSTANAPSGIFGHTAIILPDGRIFVFGGFSQTQGSLVPLSIMWILDTTQNPFTWIQVTTDTGSLPSPRMAFAAVFIGNGLILIHGGSDGNLQINFDDGWILDTTQNPMTWTQRPTLSQLGARRDHFAVCYNDQVIFGFGYQNNGPAPAPLQIYNPSSDYFSPTYTPPPVTAIPTQTLPRPSPTGSSGSNTRPAPTIPAVHPTTTSPTSNPGDGDGKAKNVAAIAIGTVFGILGLVAVGAGVVYYTRRQHEKGVAGRQFMALDGDDDEASAHAHPVPAANMRETYDNPRSRGLLASLGLAGLSGAAATKSRPVRDAQERRDMLADEDARSFGEWYETRQRDAAAGSSWSLKSILGATRRLRSREGSYNSRHTLEPSDSTPWREKADPFSDGSLNMQDERTGFIGAAAVGSRPLNRREISYASSRSGTSYRDPFADPIQEEERADLPFQGFGHPYNHEVNDPTLPTVRQVSSLPPLKTVLPLSQQAPPPMSPLSERTSQSTLPRDFNTLSSSQATSTENALLTPFEGSSMSRATSRTSMEPPLSPHSPPLKASSSSSIIGAQGQNQPMKRSDSWWSRFAHTSLLDRRSSTVSRKQYDIRDPNPPPRLGAIEEASSSSAQSKISPGTSAGSKASPKKALSRAGSGIYRPTHGKSMTSIRTADSEAIERMAGTMDVIQRVKTRSQHTRGSMSSTGGMSVDTHISKFSLEGGEVGEAGDLVMFTSPVDMDAASQRPVSAPATTSSALPTYPPRPIVSRSQSPERASGLPSSSSSPSKSSGNVSSRIQEFERRMSQDQPSSPPATNTKQHEERAKKRITVDYGLVPRASLFVANPDHRLSGSGSTDAS